MAPTVEPRRNFSRVFKPRHIGPCLATSVLRFLCSLLHTDTRYHRERTMPFKAPSTINEAASLLYRQLPRNLRGTLAAGPGPLGVPIALLHGLALLHPGIASSITPLDIVFAGATDIEWPVKLTLNRNSTDRLRLPEIRSTFVGADLPIDYEDETLWLVAGQSPHAIKRDFHACLLAHFHRRGLVPRPDLICMFHPGIEYNLFLWLRDTGLRDYVRAGVPVLVSAYRLEEARADRALLEAVGFQLTAIAENPAAPAVPNSTHRGGERFGHFLYSIVGVDMDRWSHPDVATITRFAASSQSVDIPAAGIAKIQRRERITTSGGFDERQLEAEVFDRVVENSGHSPYHVRRLLSPANSPKHQNDDYAAAYLSISVLDERPDEIASFLADHPSALHAVDGHGRSPLHVAAAFALPNMVEFLVGAGFDVNQLSDAGETPLSCCLVEECDECADILIDAGASTDIGGQGMPRGLLMHYLDRARRANTTSNASLARQPA